MTNAAAAHVARASVNSPVPAPAEPVTARRDRVPTRSGLPEPTIAWWVIWVILAGAGLMRLYGGLGWSLWDDEETAIYYALNSHKSFPRAFPLFFWLLGGVFDVTGVSVTAARLLVAFIGILTLWLAYRCARYAGERVAVIAVALMALSPGHLFWSQSIRYYVLVLAMQLLSIWGFLEGLSTHRRRWFILSAAAMLLAVSSHYSAVLLVPVYGIVLLLMRGHGLSARRHWMALVALGAAGLSVLGFFSAGFDQVRLVLDGGVWRSEFPSEALKAMGFYFGVPAVLLAIVGLIRPPAAPLSAFFIVLTVLVPLELITIRYLRVTYYVLWYYGLVGLLGVCVLGAQGLLEVADRTPRTVRTTLILAVIVVYAACLAAYYGTAFGDRPRWRDAAQYLAAQIPRNSVPQPAIYAGSPGVIAHYLGVPPAATMGHPLVQHPPREKPSGESWWVLEKRLIHPLEWKWFNQHHCTAKAQFDSHMLVRERTVVVLHCGPQS